MAALSLRDFKKVQVILTKAQATIKLAGTLVPLFTEYNIGRPSAAGWVLSASDRSRLRRVVADLNGLDPIGANLKGSRMDLAAQGATDEKLARERPLATRVVCTALPGPITYAGEDLPAVPDVEYRLDYRRLVLTDYDAVLCIENYEAFLSASLFNWQPVGNVLVLYRGHDESARAAIALMQAFSDAGRPVIYSTDTDPAGVNILLNSSATHALVPCHHWLSEQKGRGHRQRAAEQLVRLPGIQERVSNDQCLTEAYKKHALWVLSGRALTEERLLALAAPMEMVLVRQAPGQS